MDVIRWGEVEPEPEVDEWIDSLDQHGQETVAFYIDQLAIRGVLLGEPYSRQLSGRPILRTRSDDYGHPEVVG